MMRRDGPWKVLGSNEGSLKLRRYLVVALHSCFLSLTLFTFFSLQLALNGFECFLTSYIFFSEPHNV